MLKYDEQLFCLATGQIGEPLEKAIAQLTNTKISENSFGSVFPLNMLLTNKEKAIKIISTTVKTYWGNVDLFLLEALNGFNIPLDNANERLQSFFSSSQGEKAIFDYLQVHNTFRFENLINLVFGKEVIFEKSIGGLNCLYLYKVSNKYFVHIIYNDKADFWNAVFVKKIYSLFLEAPLDDIQNPISLLKNLKWQLKKVHSPNKSIDIISNLIEKIEFENLRSFQLKELQLFNIICHFNGGKRQHRKVKKQIDDVLESWGSGKWALSEKEQTLLNYILTLEAASQNEIGKIIDHGQYLITEDRLNNHAIELVLEYNDVLPDLKPEPGTLVKRYDKNYLEQIFFVLIDALVQMGRFSDVIYLLKEHEIASCTSIYEYCNAVNKDKDLLHHIEATVQRDIAFIVDNSPQHVLQSIETWLNQYENVDSPYYEVAEMTSKHVCNLLRALFATAQYELFEKLMEIYKKYLKMDHHFNNLRNFVAEFVND